MPVRQPRSGSQEIYVDGNGSQSQRTLAHTLVQAPPLNVSARALQLSKVAAGIAGLPPEALPPLPLPALPVVPALPPTPASTPASAPGAGPPPSHPEASTNDVAS